MQPSTVLNAVLFQVGWFVCVLGGNSVSVLAVIVMLLCHWLFVSKNSGEWKSILFVAVLGVLIDSLLFSLSVLVFPQHDLLPPIWLMSLWIIFATTLNHAFKWLQSHLMLAVWVGGIFGPLSYLAGVKLTDVDFGISSVYALLILSVIWAIFLPFALHVPVRFRG